MTKLRMGIAAGVLLVCASIAVAGPPKGLWKSLLTKGAKWTIKNNDTANDDAPKSVTVEVVDARKLGAADVVKLEYTFDGGNPDMVGEGYAPQLLAITKKGVYVLEADATDATITKALKKKPFFTEPPKVSKIYKRKDGGFVMVPTDAKGAACFGVGATDPSCGSAPCYSYLCLDATGVVGVGGTEDGSSFGVSVSDNPY
jgi:hypothetical protein